MKIIHVLILAMIQITVIPVVAALSSGHQAPAAIRLVSNDNMTTIYKRPGIAQYNPNAAKASAGTFSALDI